MSYYEVFVDEGPATGRLPMRFDTETEAEEYAASATDGKWKVYKVSETRYSIGTVGEDGIFCFDTIGNDPELTTFDVLSQAINEIRECIAHSPEEPLTNAAIFDNEHCRIVWRQDEDTGETASN